MTSDRLHILTEDSVEFLTDRWGELHRQYEDKPLDDLIDAMCGAHETSFIGIKEGIMGILMEIEYVHTESDEVHWAEGDGPLCTKEEVFKRLRLGTMETLLNEFPDLECWCEQGPQVACNRIAFRCFIPEGHRYLGYTEEIGRLMFGLKLEPKI